MTAGNRTKNFFHRVTLAGIVNNFIVILWNFKAARLIILQPTFQDINFKCSTSPMRVNCGKYFTLCVFTFHYLSIFSSFSSFFLDNRNRNEIFQEISGWIQKLRSVPNERRRVKCKQTFRNVVISARRDQFWWRWKWNYWCRNNENCEILTFVSMPLHLFSLVRGTRGTREGDFYENLLNYLPNEKFAFIPGDPSPNEMMMAFSRKLIRRRIQ